MPRSFVFVLAVEAIALLVVVGVSLYNVVTAYPGTVGSNIADGACAVVPGALFWVWTWLAARNAASDRRALWLGPRTVASVAVIVLIVIGALFGIAAAFFALSGGPPPTAIPTSIAVVAIALLLVSAEITMVVGAVAAWRRKPSSSPR